MAPRRAYPSSFAAPCRQFERGEQHAPVFGQLALEQHERKAMTCDVVLRDLVPAAMLDRDARLFAQRFEAHVELRRLAGRECRLAPCQREPFAGLPDGDAADLELPAV